MAQQRVGIRNGSLERTKFIMTIDTTKAGSASNTFIMPAQSSTISYNAIIEWGDGTSSSITSHTDTDLTHVYSNGGIYQIKISGDFPWIRFNSSGDRLKVISIDQWGTIQWRNMERSFFGCSNLVINANDVPNFSLVTSFGAAFQSCTSLTNISFANTNLASCTTFGGTSTGAFRGCTSLVSVSFNNAVFRTSSAVNMQEMFVLCSSLLSVDLSNINLSGVTNMAQMFMSCSGLTTFNITNTLFNTIGVNTSTMFSGCINLSNIIGLENWDAKFTNLGNMFSNCDSLTIVNLSNWDTSLVVTIVNLFNGCNNLTSVDMSGLDLSSCTAWGGGFTGAFYQCTSLISVDVTGVIMRTAGAVTMRETFAYCSSLTTVTGFNTLDLSKVTSMQQMFRSCGLLSNINLSGLDLSSCTDLSMMFTSCSSLTTLDTTGVSFNTIGVNTSSMFSGCVNLTNITDIENWNAKFTNLGAMFASCGITGALNISNWDTSNVVSLSQFLHSTTNLTSVDMSGLDLSSCTTWGARYAGAFYGSGTDYINVTDVIIRTAGTVIMYDPFYNLGTCDIVGLDTWNVTNVSQMNDFMHGTTITTTEYDKLLIAWDLLDVTNNMAVKFGSSKYTLGGAAATARAGLITNDAWTITDGGGI
jgi:surface protein